MNRTFTYHRARIITVGYGQSMFSNQNWVGIKMQFTCFSCLGFGSLPDRPPSLTYPSFPSYPFFSFTKVDIKEKHQVKLVIWNGQESPRAVLDFHIPQSPNK